MADLNFAGPVVGQKNIAEPLNLGKDFFTASGPSWNINEDKEENLIESVSVSNEPLHIQDKTAQAIQKPAALQDRVSARVAEVEAAGTAQQQADFAVPVTSEQWRMISTAASQSDNPDEELQRYAAALTYGREYGVDTETALQNLNEFTMHQLGKPYSPTTTGVQAIANSFKVGKLNMQFNDLAYDLKQADLKGEDISGYLTELDSMATEIASLQDYQPRNIATTALKWTMEGAVPYMIEVGKASLIGATAAGALGTAFTGATGIALGSLAAASPWTMAGIIAMGATVGAINRTRELEEGATYLNLRQMGVDKDIANVLSRTNAMVVGAIEAGLGIEAGTVLKAIGGDTLASQVTSAVVARLNTSGALGALANAAVSTTVGAGGEFIQEFTQEISDITHTYIAHAWQSMRTDTEPLPDENTLKQALYAGYRGFVSAIVLGAASSVVNSNFDLRQQAKMKADAKANPSKEAFVASLKDSKPESVTGADWSEATSGIWEKAHKDQKQSTSIQSEEAAVNELDYGAGEKAKGSVRRLSTGELYTKEDGTPTTDTSGAEHHRLLVGDPATGARYGHIEYAISDNTLTINDVRVKSGYENIRQESILSLAKQYPGYYIQWEAKGENLQAIKDSIIESNPRGKDAGLQYFDGVTNVDERIKLESQIKEAMPNLNASERALGATMIQLTAEAQGKTAEAYLQSSFKDGKLFGDTQDLDSAMQGKKGAVSFTNDLKAIIYAGEKADFSTFAHETFHVAMRNMGQLEQFKTAVTEAAQTPEFTTWLEDHAELFKDSNFEGMSSKDLVELAADFSTDTWSRRHDEFSARLYEGYLADGKTASPKLQGLFRRIAEWMGRIYTTLKHSVALDPRIVEAFDSMLDADTPLAQAARETQPTSSKSDGDTLYQEGGLFVDSPTSVSNTIARKLGAKMTGKGRMTDGYGSRYYQLKDGATLRISNHRAVWDRSDAMINIVISEDFISIQLKAGGVFKLSQYMLGESKKSVEGNIYNYSGNSQEMSDQISEDLKEIKNIDWEEKFKQFYGNTKANKQNMLFQGIDAQRQYDAVMSEYTGTDQWMKAPNGKPTNLNERQWVQVRTPAFLEWFGDWMNDPQNASKVVDENGEPKVVYHSTNTEFEAFDTSDKSLDFTIPNNRGDNIGAFFTTSARNSKYFGNNTMEVYLSIQNPKVFDTQDNFREFVRSNFKMEEETLTESAKFSNDTRRILEEQGYDGVIIKKAQFGGKTSKESWYVAFSPTQIKSATGNVGTFDGENPNILFQEDGKPVIETDFPKRPKINLFDYFDNIDEYTTIMDTWKSDLKAWVENAPDLLQFGNEDLVHVIHENVRPGEGPWRSTSFINFKGEWIPSGHSAYDTKYEAVKEGMELKDYRPDILFQEAYHGTGATFDKFDPAYMGAGEGSQAYGWGFYLSDSFGVSNNYRIIASYDPDSQVINGKPLSEEYDRIESKAAKSPWMYDILDGIEMLMMHETRDTVIQQLKENEADPKAVKYFKDAKYRTFGNVYITDFSDDLNIVDYYTPLSEEDYNRLIERLTALGIEQDNEIEMQDMLDALSPDLTAGEVYGYISGALEDDMDMKRGTSEFLDSIGIHGFSYPAKDQAGNESSTGSNFVIFNAENIQIKSTVLFQEDNKSFSEHLLEDARSFDSWEEFMAFTQAFADPDDPASTNEAWYQEVFNEAHGIVDEESAEQAQQAARKLKTEQDKDAYMIDRLSTDEGVVEFLKKLGWMMDDGALKQIEGDYEAYDAIYEVRNALDSIHPTITNNAMRAYRNREVTPSSIKRVRTLMTVDAVRYYRDVYANVMEDKELIPQVMDDNLPGIDDPGYKEIERLSIADRAKLATNIKADKLKRKFLSGQETFVGDAEIVIRNADVRIKDLKAEVKNAEAEIAKLEKELTEEEKTKLYYSRRYNEALSALNQTLAKVKKLRDAGESIPKELSRDAYNAQAKKDRIYEEVKAIKKTERMKATEKKNDAIKALKAELAAKRAERAEAKRVREYKIRLARKLMVKPSDTTNYEQAKAIYAIQALIDPNFRRDSLYAAEDGQRVKLTLEEAREFFDGSTEEEIIDTIGKRNYERLVEERKPLNDWTVAELEELVNETAMLRYEGRRIFEAKVERQNAIAERYQDSIMRSLIASGKYTDQPLVGTKQDQKEKQSPKRTLRGMKYGTYNMRVKAMMLDGDRQGDAYNLLVMQKRAAQAKEWTNTERRLRPFYESMKETGLSYRDLFETVKIDLDMHRSWDMSYSMLMYGWLSQFNEDNRNAVAYGSLVEQKDKMNLNHDNQLIRALGDQRYKAFMQQAEYHLFNEVHEGKYEQVLKAIQETLNNETDRDRINEIAIREFNKPMRNVEQYLPLLRLAFNGEDMAEQVAEDFFNQNAGGMPTSAQKGFTKDRIKISPDKQKPVNMDIVKVLDQSIKAQEHFIAFAEYGRKLNRVFKNYGTTDLKHVIDRTLGPEMMDDINEYINMVLNPTRRTDLNNMQKGLKFMRGNLGSAYLIFKSSSMVLQAITSPWPGVIDVNPKYLVQGYMQLFSNPLKAIEDINTLSPMMKNRNMNVIIEDIIKQANEIGNPAWLRILKKGQEIGALGLTYVDRYAVAGQWIGAYNQRMDQLNNEGVASAEAQQRSVAYADDIILKTQPTGDRTELAPLFSTNNELVRSFVQFTTSLNVIWSNITYDMRIAAKNATDQTIPHEARKAQLSKVIGTIVGYGMAGAILGAVREGHDEDDDKLDKLRNFIYWSFTQGADSVPLIGDKVSELVRGVVTGDKIHFWGDDFFPALSEVLDGLKDLSQGDYARSLKKLMKGVGYTMGAPVSGIQELVEVTEKGPKALLGR